MIRRAIAAAVLLAAAGTASAFVRETTVPGDPTAGKCLYWGTRTVPYRVNSTSAAAPPLRPACPTCAPCQDATAATALITATLPAWGGATQAGAAQACTDFNLQYGGTSTSTTLGNDGVNLVVFRTGWCANANLVPLNDPCRATVGACAAKYNCWEHDASGTIGLTTITFTTSTGAMIDADIEFHGWDGDSNGYYLTCPASPACSNPPFGQVNCTAVDVGSVALHEAGHVVGLDHTCVYPAPNNACPPNSVMQPTIPNGTTRRNLDADDVNGICTIYPRGGATLTCGSGGGGGGSTSTGGGGCSSGGQGGWLALAAAALGVFRMRRRRE
ncbi:MAG: matrixin family metalloprotease [Deltaproteobacteria bacterium]